MNSLVFVPDLDALRRKLANPPPLLARLYPHFQERLAADPEFRRHHIYLPALLGEAAAIAEAKALILESACDPVALAAGQSPRSKTSARNSLDNHIWCVTPRAMRLAVYFNWLDAQGAWTPDERRAVAAGLMDFFHEYVIPVLRARVPAGHNQQLSMTLCSAVVGHILSSEPGVAEQARALHEYAMPKLRQTLGLMSASGYGGEGSTYHSVVVAGLVMWAGLFFSQLGESDIWSRPWAPNGGRLADTLRMEAALGSCGGLLPPWDQYGWARLHNLAARTLWATLAGHHHLLPAAEAAWDEEGYLAWRPDDRLWAILYWPGEEKTGVAQPSASLSGWSLSGVGAAIEHLPVRMRVMVAWDPCGGGLQGLCRGQTNPNHLMVELAGEPITADGWDDGSELLFSESSTNRSLNGLSGTERQMVVQQYGSLDKWVRGSQQGFLGASCAIVVDDWDSYFPRSGVQGRLVYERRTQERHTFASEASAMYRPAFDVQRMRRTVSVDAAGLVWVVDDVEAESPHRFTWRAWFRRAARLDGPLRLRLDLPSGVSMTLAWMGEGAGAVEPATLAVVPTFPSMRECWPDTGSVRCDLALTGRRVRFVACMTPFKAADLQVRQTAPNAWEAVWRDGASLFALPPELDNTPDAEPKPEPGPVEKGALCDFDEEPFGLLDEPDAALLADLDSAPPGNWRRTLAAMQTLTVRGNRAALPKIVVLLQDARQNYTVHSVAAWCLGRVRYAPALDALRRMASIPEDNTALRARWAVERILNAKF